MLTGAPSAVLTCGRLLGELRNAAPAGRYSAKAYIDAARGIQARQRMFLTRPPGTLFRGLRIDTAVAAVSRAGGPGGARP
jgi:hypothetical protein